MSTELIFDDKTKDQNRTQIFKILADIGTECGYEATALGDLLSLKNIKGYGGLGDVTQLLKWAVKYHRTRGVHTTPTVFINGTEAVDVSSRWSVDGEVEAYAQIKAT
jgi:hypothetical protein